MKKNIKIVFWTLAISFILVLGEFFIPPFQDLLVGKLFLILPAIFSFLGLALLVLALKEKGREKLDKFLLLTGASATGFFVFIILHNLLYALNILVGQISILAFLAGVLSVAFFLLAVIISPLAFLVGVIGTIILLVKKR